ncbi:hypothetical protein DFH08DRAFT_986296 [Mycena albidolilacea]|uniref:Uncharacterized protein n=1 Tax=Mycena albidolilacea TaxID=1033008 RepID=A0AAD7E9P3_9AGAR|nr:hypothetical protein DFH08DRAFT_986296 [Mycena albidolilacea]
MMSTFEFLTSAAFDTIWLASPPPPFPTSSFVGAACTFFGRYCSGSSHTEFQSPVFDGAKSPILDHEAIEFSRASVMHLPPVFPLDCDQSLRRSNLNCYETCYDRKATSSRGQAMTGAGLGLGLSVPYGYALSVGTERNDLVEGWTSPTPNTIPEPKKGLLDGLLSFFDAIYDIFPASPSPPPPQSLTGILPHVFTDSALSPIMFWHPAPLTPESDWPRHLIPQGTPIYQRSSPILPAASGVRARHRPSPRRPRPCSSVIDLKSPVFEYERSAGTTPYDRHGWDPIESFNASRRRGPSKPARSAKPAEPLEVVVELAPAAIECPDCDTVKCVCYSPMSVAEADAPRLQLPWLRGPVLSAPYTRLPPSPALPSVIARSPRAENHHCQVNRYQSERVRRSLMRLSFGEPWAAGDVPLVRTPEEERERRRELLVREERVVERRRWWVSEDVNIAGQWTLAMKDKGVPYLYRRKKL